MDVQTFRAMEAELALLDAKASAIRSVINLYRDQYNPQSVKPSPIQSARSAAPTNSTFTDAILQVARRVVTEAGGVPVPTTTILSAVEDAGIEVAAAVPRNVISSALSRSAEFKANGRVGWTLSGAPSLVSSEFDDVLGSSIHHNENEPHSGDAGGSETGEEGAATPSNPWRPSN